MGINIILALTIGILLMVILITKTKLHPGLVIIFVSALIGLFGGMDIISIGGVIKNGFGNTLASIGIVICFGMMMGQIIEKSGAAKVMARSFIKLLGEKNNDLAMAVTGFVVSIPIFADSGYVVLSPLVKAISKNTKKSIVTLSFALGMGLLIANVCVPPTPGPLAAAGIYGINIGLYIVFSIIMSIPLLIVTTIVSRIIGEKYYRIPGDNEGEFITSREEALNYVAQAASNDENEILPSVTASFAPIVLPLVLIMISSILGLIYTDAATMPVAAQIFSLLGNPIIAVGIGVIAAIYGLTGKENRETVLDTMEEGLKSAGMILLVTGAGGSLGNIISTSGAGDVIANTLSHSPIPLIIIPFVISAVLRLVQGSGTVAVTTAASLTAPILLPLGVNPYLAVFSACIGSQLFAIFNDSFFWLVVKSTGLKSIKDQLGAWSMTEFITSCFGLAEILIVSIFLH